MKDMEALVDDEDLSRRRSSRLKTLEARKEQEKVLTFRHKDMDETSGDSSLVNNSDANESQHSVTDSSNHKIKKKKSKKDKNKTKDRDCDQKKGKRKPNHCPYITSLAHLKISSDFDDNESTPKPEKVKSRWMRNSELESGHGLAQNAQSVPITISKETEPTPHFDAIDENVYLFERRKSKTKKESRRMVCDCILTKEERARGLIGCGEDCLNRMLMIECGSRCALGDHCANKRFQKKQYAKVEPYRTPKKGWGLRALEPIQPNTFIMEYIGEVIDPLDFHNRTQKYSKEKREHHFFMALKSDEIIDATIKGNITRFVNHSCDPNSETQKWTVNGDLRIGFFTQRFVQAGEEITFDYQFQRYGKEAQKCFCDSVNCRGFIGASESANILTDGSRITPKNQLMDKEMDETAEDEEILEDLALEEEIAKLSEGGGLRNRQQVLMLARLMVRAEDIASRMKLIDIIKGTVEIAYLRLLLDYHGLQLIWSWMVEVEDNELKAGILELLEILPIPNKTMLTDSKVYSVVERWSQQTDNDSLKTYSNQINLNSRFFSIKVEEPLKVYEEPLRVDEKPVKVDEESLKVDEELLKVDEEPIVDEKSVKGDEESVKLDEEPLKVDEETLKVDEETLKVDEETLKVDEETLKVDEETLKVNEEPLKVNEEPLKVNEEPLKVNEEPLKVNEEPLKVDKEPLSVDESLVDAVVSLIEPNVPSESMTCDSSQTSEDITLETDPIVKSDQFESSDEICLMTQTEELAKDVLKTDNEFEGLNQNKDSIKSSPRIELKNSSLSLVIKSRSLSNASKSDSPQILTPLVVKSKLSISSMAQKLLLNWKELKEVFRIPRLERQKRHEDEKEADRKTKEVEERRAKGLPVSYDKRGIDDRDYTIAGILGIKRKGVKRPNDSKDNSSAKKCSNALTPISANLKISKEEHRKMFEREVQHKDYMEALKRYHQELAYYNAVYGQQYQQQQQQLYSQEPTLREQYTNACNSYEQYYQSDQNYGQTSAGYSESNSTVTFGDYMNGGTQESVECKEDEISLDIKTLLSIETTPALIPLANIDCQSIPQTESSLAIDNVPNDCIVYSDSVDTKTDNNSIFDPTFPPPGVFYHTPEGTNYFTPIPVDRKERAINLVFNDNITLPFGSNATKTMTTNQLGTNWRQCFDKFENFFYFHKIKRKSQWFAPEEERPVSPAKEEVIETIDEHKLSDNEDSTSVPEMSSQLSPKPEETDELNGSIAPDSISIPIEVDNTINSTDSPSNLLQSLLALEADPRKRRHIFNSVVPSTTTAAADTSSSSNGKKFASTRQIQEYFRNKMSEYVVHCLNPYRRAECKKGRIVNNNDFKYLARKLTHTIMGKEIKQCKSLEHLSCNDAVKHKTKDYVKKYMARFGPYYKSDNSNERVVSPKDSMVANDSND